MATCLVIASRQLQFCATVPQHCSGVEFQRRRYPQKYLSFQVQNRHDRLAISWQTDASNKRICPTQRTGTECHARANGCARARTRICSRTRTYQRAQGNKVTERETETKTETERETRPNTLKASGHSFLHLHRLICAENRQADRPTKLTRRPTHIHTHTHTHAHTHDTHSRRDIET